MLIYKIQDLIYLTRYVDTINIWFNWYSGTNIGNSLILPIEYGNAITSKITLFYSFPGDN